MEGILKRRYLGETSWSSKVKQKIQFRNKSESGSISLSNTGSK